MESGCLVSATLILVSPMNSRQSFIPWTRSRYTIYDNQGHNDFDIDIDIDISQYLTCILVYYITLGFGFVLKNISSEILFLIKLTLIRVFGFVFLPFITYKEQKEDCYQISWRSWNMYYSTSLKPMSSFLFFD